MSRPEDKRQQVSRPTPRKKPREFQMCLLCKGSGKYYKLGSGTPTICENCNGLGEVELKADE